MQQNRKTVIDHALWSLGDRFYNTPPVCSTHISNDRLAGFLAHGAGLTPDRTSLHNGTVVTSDET